MAQPVRCENCDLSESTIKSLDDFKDALQLMTKHNIKKVRDWKRAKELLYTHLAEVHQPKNPCVIQQLAQTYHEKLNALKANGDELKDVIIQFPKERKDELDSYFDGDVIKAIDDSMQKISSKGCIFMVAGETGSGKSAFINLLLNQLEGFLPVCTTPTTASLTQIYHGPQKKLTAYPSKGGDKEEIYLTEENALQKLDEYTNQKEGRTEQTYGMVDVEWPCDWLKYGLKIIDSPGVGENKTLNATVKENMSVAHGYILMLNLKNGNGVNKEQLKELLMKHSSKSKFDPHTIIFVGNKCDGMSAEEKEKMKESVCKDLHAVLGVDVKHQVYFISTTETIDIMKTGWTPEEYITLQKGLRKMAGFTMTKDIMSHFELLKEITEKCCFMLERVSTQIDDAGKAFEKLDSLEGKCVRLHRTLVTKLEEEAKKISKDFTAYLQADNTKEMLLIWDKNDCPNPQRGTEWSECSTHIFLAVKERVCNEIQDWIQRTGAFRGAQERIVGVFQQEYDSLMSQLSQAEMDIFIDESEKHTVEILLEGFRKGNYNFRKTQQEICGIAAPFHVSFHGFLADVFKDCFTLILCQEIVFDDDAQERSKKYLKNMDSRQQIMAETTSLLVALLLNYPDVKSLFSEAMKEFENNMLILIRKVPVLISADKNLVNQLADQVRKETVVWNKTNRTSLLRKVMELGNTLNKFQPENLETSKEIATG